MGIERKRSKRQRYGKRKRKKEIERERERSNATITTLAVSSSERAHGLGRRCGVIQSRFRPMNFLQREEGDPAGWSW